MVAELLTTIDLPGPADSTPPAPGGRIEIRGLRKQFRARGRHVTAFADLDLTVAPGEIVCLVGPSGCGKSTLLRTLAGTLRADAGEVTVDGREITRPGPDRGMLFQTPLLFPWLTARDNVLFGPRAQRSRGLDERDDAALRAEVDGILATVGLADAANAYPHELSGGMQHRVAFARAIITRPSVLLMDEPFGALDAFTRTRMQRFLLATRAVHPATVVFVTHDIEEAALLGDRVVVMGGRPPGIAAVLPVDIPRARAARDVDSAELVAVKRRIRDALVH